MLGSGEDIYQIAERIYPICRSITGDGVRRTLDILKEYYPDMNVFEVPSGTKAFDWTVPKEWNIQGGYIEDDKGNIIIDFANHNLHVMGYSTPIDKWVSLEELKKIIYTQPEQPDVIPYVTSYYKERYGFCMSENQKQSLKEGQYHIVIDSELKNGSLTYGEIIIPGESKKEMLISTYICHPSMANDECSGPSLSICLANWIKSQKRKYTYRLIYIPETIGSITYLNCNYQYLKENVIAGFNLSCVGDEKGYSFVSTKYGNTLTDRLIENVLKNHSSDFIKYSYLKRASDERQFNAPGIDLPVCGFSKSNLGQFPEYHTSADNLDLISPKGFQESYDVMKECIDVFENNGKYMINVLCEPQLGKRGLYPTISQKGTYEEVTAMFDFIAYADGKNDLLGISEIIGVPAIKLIPIIKKLYENDLLER